jgi:hypothetical protein
MKNNFKKSVKSLPRSKKGKVLIAVMITLSSFGIVNTAVAANNSGNGLLDLLKQAGVIIGALDSFTKVADEFKNGIQTVSTLGNPDSIRGILGQYAPELGEAQVDKKVSAADNSLTFNSNQGISSAATGKLAANQVLSISAQKSAKETKDKITELDKNTGATADLVFQDATDAQSFSSSQDVLKRISYQLSGQADISAAQVRLSVLQNNSSQEVTTQLGAMNSVIASTAERERGQLQAKSLAKAQDGLGASTFIFNAITQQGW